MYEGSISRDTGIRVEIVKGFPTSLDCLARRSPDGRCFLRAAWYEASASGNPMTIIATREDGVPFAAIPTDDIGPPLIGARSVPGSYWPFRSILVAADIEHDELRAMLAEPSVRRALAPVWRVGPVLQSDPATQMLKKAAAAAGWTVLIRRLGESWELDLGVQGEGGPWPRKSTRRRIANYQRRLEREGEVQFRFVTGSDWDGSVFEALGEIEANSWIARNTDGSGAKFLTPEKRALWHRAIRDPYIAAALSATLLIADGKPVAFSFDLRTGDRQYSIASSYDEGFAALRVGRIVTCRQLEWAAASGVKTVDLGAGDSGYKREMGAEPGSEIVDLLIVASRSLGHLLSLKWGSESELARTAFLVSGHASARRNRIVSHLVAAGAVAGTVLAASE